MLIRNNEYAQAKKEVVKWKTCQQITSKNILNIII